MASAHKPQPPLVVLVPVEISRLTDGTIGRIQFPSSKQITAIIDSAPVVFETSDAAMDALTRMASADGQAFLANVKPTKPFSPKRRVRTRA